MPVASDVNFAETICENLIYHNKNKFTVGLKEKEDPSVTQLYTPARHKVCALDEHFTS